MPVNSGIPEQESYSMTHQHWYKKDVVLNWQGQRLTFAVAQELFSSHDVDAGSKLLLKSLNPETQPVQGLAVDFGCGYGVLGLAWAVVKPEWEVLLIDRDHLAVVFASRNARQLNPSNAAAIDGVGLDAVPAGGAHLLLWNVPGKVGEPVVEALTQHALASLAEGGLLALVVVNPLADLIRATIGTDPQVSIQFDQAFADHTVIHARSNNPATGAGDSFERGVFDREPAGFGVDDFDYDITPVIGLPEYDTYGYATEVTFDLLRTVIGAPASVLVIHPGQGHVPLATANMFRPDHILMVDRDVLAIRASLRAMLVDQLAGVRVAGATLVDLVEVESAGPFDLAVLMLEEQVRNELHQARLLDLAALVPVGGQVVVGGTSATVSRFLALAAKMGSWKTRDRARRSGASAARLQRVT
jgi:16S rRNA (guanine1207-N2)-methyltransferase